MTIVAPPSSRAKVVSVTAAGVSVQAAIERLLRTAGYSNYVLVFEADGHARRLLVLDRDRVPSPSGSPVSHVNGDLAPTVRIDAPATARSFDLPVIGQAPTAAHASTPPASMGSATPRGSSAVPNRALQDAGQRIRQRMAAWNTLSAPERQQIREYLRQLPLAERVELTVYLRHHALGQPLDD